jgi:cell division protein FtsA
MPVRLGAPQHVRGLSDIVNNPIYSTAVGLLIYAMKQQHQDAGRSAHQHTKEHQGSFFGKLKKLFQSNF